MFSTIWGVSKGWCVIDIDPFLLGLRVDFWVYLLGCVGLLAYLVVGSSC